MLNHVFKHVSNNIKIVYSMKRYQIVALSIIFLMVLYYLHNKTNKLQSDVIMLAEKYETIVHDNIMHNNNLDKVIKMIENSVESVIHNGNETSLHPNTIRDIDRQNYCTVKNPRENNKVSPIEKPMDAPIAIENELVQSTEDDKNCVIDAPIAPLHVNVCGIKQCDNLSTIDELDSNNETIDNCLDNGHHQSTCQSIGRSVTSNDLTRLSDIDTDSDAFDSDSDGEDEVKVGGVGIDGGVRIDDEREVTVNTYSTMTNIISSYSNDSVEDVYPEDESINDVQATGDSDLNANIMNADVMNACIDVTLTNKESVGADVASVTIVDMGRTVDIVDKDIMFIQKADLIDELQQKLPFINSGQPYSDQVHNAAPLPDTATSSDIPDGTSYMSVTIDNIPNMSNSEITKLKLQCIKQLATDLHIATTHDGFKKKTKKELVGEILSYKKNILNIV
jgi:hypothetical protein